MSPTGTYRLAIAALCVFIIGACTLPISNPQPTPEPTMPAPAPTALAYQNLTTHFAWLAEPDARFAGVSFLAKGTVVGSQVVVTFTGRFTEQPNADMPGGGWYIWADTAFRPAFPSVPEVGTCIFQRGYHQRGLTGGAVWWEQVPEGSGNWVLRPKLGLQANTNGRLDIHYPFDWEKGDWWSCTIVYEAIGG